MIASSAGHEDIVILLLEKKADVHEVNFTGQSCLHYAASKNHLSVSLIAAWFTNLFLLPTYQSSSQEST